MRTPKLYNMRANFLKLQINERLYKLDPYENAQSL